MRPESPARRSQAPVAVRLAVRHQHALARRDVVARRQQALTPLVDPFHDLSGRWDALGVAERVSAAHGWNVAQGCSSRTQPRAVYWRPAVTILVQRMFTRTVGKCAGGAVLAGATFGHAVCVHAEAPAPLEVVEVAGSSTAVSSMDTVYFGPATTQQGTSAERPVPKWPDGSFQGFAHDLTEIDVPSLELHELYEK